METVGLEPTSTSLQARCSPRLSYVPEKKGADGWSRTTTAMHRCISRRRGYSPLSSPMLSVRRTTDPVLQGGRPDSNRHREDHDLGCCRYTTATTLHGDDRTRTGGLSLDKRALFPLSYAPKRGRAGGIRTHGLELMRLARTATPLPRCGQAGLAGRSRTCDLRRPKPAGWPRSPTTRRTSAPPAGFEPAASG